MNYDIPFVEVDVNLALYQTQATGYKTGPQWNPVLHPLRPGQRFYLSRDIRAMPGVRVERETIILANARFRVLQADVAPWLHVDLVILDSWRALGWRLIWPLRRVATDINRRLQETAWIWGLLDPPGQVRPEWRNFRLFNWWRSKSERKADPDEAE